MKIYEVRVGFNKEVDIYGNTEYTPNFEYYVDKGKGESRRSKMQRRQRIHPKQLNLENIRNTLFTQQDSLLVTSQKKKKANKK